MKRAKNSEIAYMKSMVFCLSKVIKDGYIEDFKATQGGLESVNTHKLYPPEQVKVINFFRFEGFSDPDDNAVMYVIETSDGVKGTLIDDAHGNYTHSVSNFIKEVQSSGNSPIRH